MTGYELSKTCKTHEDCKCCPARKECQKWKQKLKPINQLEPHEIDKLIDLLEELTEGDL